MRRPDDIRKLLGGYATGSLTEDERRVLFEAALKDQQLFEELMEEQALKEAIESPGARERLLAALRTTTPPRAGWPNWTWAAAGAAALAAVTIAVLVRAPESPRSTGEVAVLQKQAPHVPPASTPAEPAPARSAASPQLPPPRPGPRAMSPHTETRDVTPPQAAPPRKANLEISKDLRRPAPAADAVIEPPASPSPAAAPVSPGNQPSVSLAENGFRATVPPPEAAQVAPAPPAPAGARAGTSFGRSLGALAKTASARPALAVTVLRNDAPVATDTVFFVGDTVRLRVNPPFDGYLYIQRRETAAGDWTPVFSAPARAGVPESAAVEMAAAGEPQLRVLLSQRPMRDAAASNTSIALERTISLTIRPKR